MLLYMIISVCGNVRLLALQAGPHPYLRRDNTPALLGAASMRPDHLNKGASKKIHSHPKRTEHNHQQGNDRLQVKSEHPEQYNQPNFQVGF